MKGGEAMASYLKLNAVARCTLTFAAVLTVFTDVSVSSHTVTDFFVSTSLSFSQPVSSVAAIHKLTPKTMFLRRNSGFERRN